MSSNFTQLGGQVVSKTAVTALIQGIDDMVPLFKGEYSATATYDLNDAVSYEGSVYWHTGATSTKGTVPTNTTSWTLCLLGHNPITVTLVAETESETYTHEINTSFAAMKALLDIGTPVLLNVPSTLGLDIYGTYALTECQVDVDTVLGYSVKFGSLTFTGDGDEGHLKIDLTTHIPDGQ